MGRGTELIPVFTQNLSAIKGIDTRIAELSEQIASLQAEKTALQNLKDKTRESVLKALQTKGLYAITVTDETTGERIVFQRREGNGSVVMKPGVKIEDFPEEYVRNKKELNKVAIKAAFKPRPVRIGDDEIDAPTTEQLRLEDLVDIVKEDTLYIIKEEDLQRHTDGYVHQDQFEG